jgi:hypothetical protein
VTWTATRGGSGGGTPPARGRALGPGASGSGGCFPALLPPPCASSPLPAETPPQAAAPSPPSPGAIPIAPRPAKRLRSTRRWTGRGPLPPCRSPPRGSTSFFAPCKRAVQLTRSSPCSSRGISP